jgi:triacylglycerol lipase
MKLDYSWKSLFKPGEATNYFSFANPGSIFIGTKEFNLTNALWLAEISRLIYHNNFYKDEAINTGFLNYELLSYIENQKTSTHVAILEIVQDNPCVVIVFRGTDEIEDWGINVRAFQSAFDGHGKVHSGFKKAYLSIKKELFNALTDISLPFFITGHSLGAALAILAASELFEKENFDSGYTFGSPRIGNAEFIDSVKCKNIYRIINNCDVVTTVPVDFASIKYSHVGSAQLIDDHGSLRRNMAEEDVYNYQKSRLEGLKEYAISKFFQNDSASIKDDLPEFLADHAPVNYVMTMQKLIGS